MLILACSDTMQMCCNMAPFLKIVKLGITILQFSVPAVLIILTAIDMFKAITASDNKVGIDLSKKFGKRLIYALVIFIVPFLVQNILKLVENTVPKASDEEELPSIVAWVSCWNNITQGTYCKSCNDIYKPNEDNSNNGGNSSSGNQSTNSKKTCYAWSSMNCTNEGIKNFSYQGFSSIGTPEYNSDEKACRITVNMTDSKYAYYDNCITICAHLDSFFDGNNEGKKACYCSFNAKKNYQSSSSLPKSALDGEVNVYSCPETTSCDSYDFVTGGACELTGTKMVSKD